MAVSELLGGSVYVFLGITCVLMGFSAFVMGQALANTWKPVWHTLIYAALLGFADRFLNFSLFGGQLTSISGYLVDTMVLILIALVAYRYTQARKMVSQYPWLYRRAGPFGWRPREDVES